MTGQGRYPLDCSHSPHLHLISISFDYSYRLQPKNKIWYMDGRFISKDKSKSFISVLWQCVSDIISREKSKHYTQVLCQCGPDIFQCFLLRELCELLQQMTKRRNNYVVLYIRTYAQAGPWSRLRACANTPYPHYERKKINVGLMKRAYIKEKNEKYKQLIGDIPWRIDGMIAGHSVYKTLESRCWRQHKSAAWHTLYLY